MTHSSDWNAVYASNYSLVYVQNNNGSLYKLPISDTSIDVKDISSHLTEIAPAPTNASLVLDNDGHLLAIWGSEGCNSSPVEISQYDSNSNSWSSVAQSSFKQKWYADSQTVWIDRSEDAIYMYGGECNGSPQDGFYRYQLTTQSFDEVTSENGIMPQNMAGARALPLDDYQTLIIGGKASENAWISMQQIAIWGQGSWSFNPVSNSTGIDSRENPLLLPVWDLGMNGTNGALSQILIIGGKVAGRNAEPPIVSLTNSPTKGWYWTVPQVGTSKDSQESSIDSRAVFSLYNTLASMNSSSDDDIALFGKSSPSSDVWDQVNKVAVPENHKSSDNSDSSSSHTSTAVIAVVSTLLPVIVIALVIAAGWWFWRRRREQRFFMQGRGSNRTFHRVGSNGSSVNSWSDWTASSARNSYPVGVGLPPQGMPRSVYRDSTRGSGNGSIASTTNHDTELGKDGDDEKGSIMLMDDGAQLFMSKHRRSLRVVNPDDQYTDSVRENSSLPEHDGLEHDGLANDGMHTQHEIRQGSGEGAYASSSRQASDGSTKTRRTEQNPFADEFDFSEK